MLYMGSKARLSKELAPIIQSFIVEDTQAYVEPFVGGGNMIDKIRCEKRLGYDLEPYVVACLSALRDGWIPPKVITEAEYKDIQRNKSNYPDYLVGYAGYQLSFAGKFFGGYRRDKVGKQDYCKNAYNRSLKQAPLLKGIEFEVKDYIDLYNLKNCVIYCDPPYKGSTSYSTKKFNHEAFYEWCIKMAENNIVLVSEYDMPDDFKLIWSKDVKVGFDSNRTEGSDRVEKLFKVEI